MQLILYFFWVLALLNIAGEWMEYQPLEYATKPLLMIALGLWYFRATAGKRTATQKLILIALAFSWAGDMFLMGSTEIFFLPGLVSFLITHVLYIIGFRKEISLVQGSTLLKRQPLIAIPVVLLTGGLIVLVFNRMEPAMKIPVVVYATVITLMVLTAMNRCGRVSANSFRLVFAGAFLFMLSDSLIALNKFYFSDAMWKAGFFIMLLYIAGQFMIAKGTAKTDLT